MATKLEKRRLLARRAAREYTAADLVRGPDEPFEYPPVVTLTTGELRAFLYMALNFDRSAERTLLAYFCGCWEVGMEPDVYVLREYCHHVFQQALQGFRIDGGRPGPLLVVGPPHRPPGNIGSQTATHLLVAALFALLRTDGYGDALKRTAAAFNMSEKSVEKIAIDQERRLGDLVREIAKDERTSLLEILEARPAGKSTT